MERAIGLLLLWIPFAAVHAQFDVALSQTDSAGHVPALRLELSPPSEAARWWRRTMDQHLLDFSDREGGSNVVVVDPVVESFVGRVLPSPGMLTVEPEARAVWDNIRGARFQAILDDRWHIGGELLERQGVAEPLLGYWAVQNRIPGWGRSKLGNSTGFNTAEQAYFDVSRTRGWVGWEQADWAFDAGIDALHIGAGRSSAFLSQTAVPAPYARVSHANSDGRTACWVTRWMTPRRGPLGETAEALLERTRAVFVAHTARLTTHWNVQGVYNFSWETTAQTAPEGWEGLGMDAGDRYRPSRHVGGVELQYHRSFTNTGHLTAYAQQSWDVGRHKRAPNDREPQRAFALTRVIGWHWQHPRWTVRAEYARRDDAHCRTCWTFEDASESTGGPFRTELENAGLSAHSLWKESLRLEALGRLLPRWELGLIGELNEEARQALIQTQWQLHPIWPLNLWMALGQVHQFDAAGPYPMIAMGLRSAILSWR